MIVVTGITGRTGSATAETLLAGGLALRGIVRDPAKGERWRARGAEVAVASLTDRAALEAALDGATALFALLPEDPTVQAFHAHRRAMADAIAAAVSSAGTPHVVLVSSVGAFLSEGCGPLADLHHAEQALAATGATVSVIRAGYFQENVLGVLPLAREQRIYPCFLASAEAPVPTVATRDLGRLAASLLTDQPAGSQVIDLLGPAHSVREMAGALGHALGHELQVVEIPAAARVDSFLRAGMPRELAEALAEMFACFDSGRIRPSGDRVVTATTPLATTLREGLAAAREG